MFEVQINFAHAAVRRRDQKTKISITWIWITIVCAWISIFLIWISIVLVKISIILMWIFLTARAGVVTCGSRRHGTVRARQFPQRKTRCRMKPGILLKTITKTKTNDNICYPKQMYVQIGANCRHRFISCIQSYLNTTSN